MFQTTVFVALLNLASFFVLASSLAADEYYVYRDESSQDATAYVDMVLQTAGSAGLRTIYDAIGKAMDLGRFHDAVFLKTLLYNRLHLDLKLFPADRDSPPSSTSSMKKLRRWAVLERVEFVDLDRSIERQRKLGDLKFTTPDNYIPAWKCSNPPTGDAAKKVKAQFAEDQVRSTKALIKHYRDCQHPAFERLNKFYLDQSYSVAFLRKLEGPQYQPRKLSQQQELAELRQCVALADKLKVDPFKFKAELDAFHRRQKFRKHIQSTIRNATKTPWLALIDDAKRAFYAKMIVEGCFLFQAARLRYLIEQQVYPREVADQTRALAKPIIDGLTTLANAAVCRDRGSHWKLLQLIAAWNPVFPDDYGPGWADSPPRSNEKPSKVAKQIKHAFLNGQRSLATLLQDEEYAGSVRKVHDMELPNWQLSVLEPHDYMPARLTNEELATLLKRGREIELESGVKDGLLSRKLAAKLQEKSKR